jgi:hypothetical protein
MLSLRSNQRGLFEADHLWLDHVGRNSFYGFLALHRDELFRDEDFAELYSLKNGRPSVPPSLLASALLLQVHERCSDEEARRRACFDACWKVALGLEMESRPFAKSTLQLFRAQLILHEKMRLPLDRSLQIARKRGFLKTERKLKLALDTTNVLGWGAVKDTYNLLADGIVVLIRELARLAGRRPQEWAGEQGLSRYFNKSIKGQAEIDWSSRAAREEFLGGLVVDADRLLELARATRSKLEEGSREDDRLLAASQLLSQLLLQDIERSQGKVKIRQGTSGERIPSVHDPEMRHGRKSPTKRFDGHKLGIAVDTDEQLITAVDVMAGSAKDNEDALQLVQASEAATGVEVEVAVGDAAYGAAATRREFLNASRKLVAKVPGARENVAYFTKDRFQIDLSAMTCTCPAGETTGQVARNGFGPLRRSIRHPQVVFHFSAKICGACPLRTQCYSTKTRAGRTVLLHPEEELLAEARALQHSPDFPEFQRRRQVAEHRLARMVQLGMREARYRGHTKTLFQAAMTAAVANLTLIAGKVAPIGPSLAFSGSRATLRGALASPRGVLRYLGRRFTGPHGRRVRSLRRYRKPSFQPWLSGRVPSRVLKNRSVRGS